MNHPSITNLHLGFVSQLAFAILLSPSPIANASQLLGVDNETNSFYRISGTDASATFIGGGGSISLGSLEAAPDGTVYGFSTGSDSNLYEIDPATGQITEVGSLGLSFVFEGGLAFSPDGTAFGTNGGDAQMPQLFSIDLNSGAAVTIGQISGGQHDINGLAWRSDGTLVGLDRSTNSLLAIDPLTAAASLITALGPEVGSTGGMTAAGDRGYFTTAGQSSDPPGTGELYEFDLFSGQTTLIGSLSSPIERNGLSGLALIPEPSSIFLLLASATIASHRRRR